MNRAEAGDAVIVKEPLLATAANRDSPDNQRQHMPSDVGALSGRSHISLLTAAGSSRAGRFVMIGTSLPFKAALNVENQNLMQPGHGEVAIAALRSQPASFSP
jgi:hypothetical protein